MSQPIDELLISVEIEEGSNLEELHKMLKELQDAGGKIEVEIPGDTLKEISNNISDQEKRITQLINVLKPLMTKFPDLDLMKAVVEDILQDLTKFITVHNQWHEDFRLLILHKIKINLDQILVLRDLMDKPNVTKVQVGSGVEDKLDKMFDVMAQQFIKLFDVMGKFDGRITELKSHMTRRLNGAIKEVVNEITELIRQYNEDNSTEANGDILEKLVSITHDISNLIDSVNHNKNLILTTFTTLYDDLFQSVFLMQEVSFNVEKIMIKQGKMNEEIISLLTKVDEIYNAVPETEDIKNAISELIDAFITDQLDSILGKLEDVRIMTVVSATRSDIEVMNQWFIHMRDSVKKKLGKFTQDYYDTTLTWKNFLTKLDKIPQDRTETRRSIEQYIEKLLKGFEDKLEQNITKLIEPELNLFLDSVTAVMKGLEPKDEIKALEEEKESTLRLPGVKELGEPMALESLSGFWRTLVSLLMTFTTEQMKEHLETFRGSLGRLLEGSGIMGQRDVAKTLGFELEKDEPIFSQLGKVVDAISDYNVVDLVTAMFPEKEDIKIEEEDSLKEIKNILQELIQINFDVIRESPKQDIIDIIKKNEISVADFRDILDKISKQVQDNQNVNKQIADTSNETKKIAEDINSKLGSKTSIQEADDKDRKRVMEE